ncbi:hypothetical protein PR048_032680 [Dryococelus australis]|uniref:Alpha-2-macroglobulin receptor-associated protein domain-containing protein n=1 Tax=Dryococelus australis TaxID=614101 RepID=A0ABQ9G703_9NEOP|nr:hypothetical protein PR048_032680 [Dryococelus australis]
MVKTGKTLQADVTALHSQSPSLASTQGDLRKLGKAVHDFFFFQRLTETKLKSLYSELKIQDKEEIAWKQIKTGGLDKDGLKEAQLRKKLTGNICWECRRSFCKHYLT